MQFLRSYKATIGVILAVALVMALAGVSLATDTPVVDYSTNLTTGLTGLIAGVAASIAAVVVVAIGVRVMFKAVRLGFKSLGLIK